jgi:exodeoxyribonuclease VII small subunit
MRNFGKGGITKVVKLHKPVDYESAMSELERLVADMESGRLSLEDSLSAYKRGAELLSFCRTRLEDAQQQVKVLENGVLKDFSVAGDAGQVAAPKFFVPNGLEVSGNEA